MLVEYAISELQDRFVSGQMTSAGFGAALLQRIAAVAAPQDTAGPMARTVADAATVLTVLAGEDSRDPATRGGDAHRPADYRAFLEVSALRGARLGVARDLMGTHAGVDAVIEDALRVLADLGADLVDPANGTAVPLFGNAEMQLFLYELKASLNRYLAEHPRARVRTLEELIQFNREHAAQVMRFFGQELMELAQATGGFAEPAYLKAKAECLRLSRTDGIDKVMREHRLDALVAPTDGMPAWVIDPICGDRIQGGCSSPPAMAGYPHITVPAGYAHGLPVALSFFSGAFEEGRLIGYAYAFEQATKVRRAPTFRATVGP
jgi:amidase